MCIRDSWKVRYAPKTPEDALDDCFVEACQMHCHIEYMADVLTVGDLEERVALVDKLMQDDKIAFLHSLFCLSILSWCEIAD